MNYVIRYQFYECPDLRFGLAFQREKQHRMKILVPDYMDDKQLLRYSFVLNPYFRDEKPHRRWSSVPDYTGDTQHLKLTLVSLSTFSPD